MQFRRHLKIHVPLVIVLYSLLINGAVDPGSRNALVPQELLQLLYGHTGVKQISGTCPAEAVGMDFINVGRGADPLNEVFQASSGEPGMRSFCTDKESWVIISTQLQIFL